MEELKKLLNEHGAYKVMIVTMLFERFVNVVTLDVAIGIAEELELLDMDLNETEALIYNFEGDFNDFIRENNFDLKVTANLLFAELDFAKTVKDNYIIYTYYAVDYTIEVVFNMVEKTYQNNRYYKGAIDLDYEVETVLHDAISQFIVENFK